MIVVDGLGGSFVFFKMGRVGHLLSPAAQQDAYPLNGSRVTLQPNINTFTSEGRRPSMEGG